MNALERLAATRRLNRRPQTGNGPQPARLRIFAPASHRRSSAPPQLASSGTAPRPSGRSAGGWPAAGGGPGCERRQPGSSARRNGSWAFSSGIDGFREPARRAVRLGAPAPGEGPGQAPYQPASAGNRARDEGSGFLLRAAARAGFRCAGGPDPAARASTRTGAARRHWAVLRRDLVSALTTFTDPLAGCGQRPDQPGQPCQETGRAVGHFPGDPGAPTAAPDSGRPTGPRPR